VPAPSTSTIISSRTIEDTCRPWWAASATSGPAMTTEMNAGVTVTSARLSDRKMITSNTMMNSADRFSTRLPVLPDAFC